MECMKCGTCCVAPDIKALGKPLRVRCPHLEPAGTCGQYGERPEVCKSYRPDELCQLIVAPTLEERVEKYLLLFAL